MEKEATKAAGLTKYMQGGGKSVSSGSDLGTAQDRFKNAKGISSDQFFGRDKVIIFLILCARRSLHKEGEELTREYSSYAKKTFK